MHNSLKEGLLALGHQVTLISTGDHFKKFPSDVLLQRKFDSGIPKKIKVGLYKIFGVDITSFLLKSSFLNNTKNLKDFDVVQLINESPLTIDPRYEREIISFLIENNKKLFLLSCGADYSSIKFAFDQKPKYSILTPYFDKKISEKEAAPMLKYLKPDYHQLHQFVFENMNGVIASDLDYHLPLKENKKYCGLIPNPINTKLLSTPVLPENGKTVIFHGINRVNYYKKGNDYFEEALKKIKKKHSDRVEIITVESIPYSEYIKKYDAAHILLDQVFSYDQGYNALEAMAKGKVVFTGAEFEFLEFYNLQEDEVCINALPNVDYLYQKLEELILDRSKVLRISKNAADFVAREHHYISIAQKYVDVWQKN